MATTNVSLLYIVISYIYYVYTYKRFVIIIYKRGSNRKVYYERAASPDHHVSYTHIPNKESRISCERAENAKDNIPQINYSNENILYVKIT